MVLASQINKISNFIYDKDSDVVAYKVEAPEGSAIQASAETSTDISALLALGDISNGEKQFKKCKACHSIKQGGGNKIGPKLWNVMFRKVGSIGDIIDVKNQIKILINEMVRAES